MGRLFTSKRNWLVVLTVLLLVLTTYTTAYAIDVFFDFITCVGDGTTMIITSHPGSNYDLRVVAVDDILYCDDIDGGLYHSGLPTMLTFSLDDGTPFTLTGFTAQDYAGGETLLVAPNGDVGRAEVFEVPTTASTTFTPSNSANFSDITFFQVTKQGGGAIEGAIVVSVNIPFDPTAVDVSEFRVNSGVKQTSLALPLATLFIGLGAVVFVRRR